MILGFVLASWLTTQAWSWPTVPNATFYRIYWSVYSTSWCSSQYQEFSASTICRDGTCQADIPEPQNAELIFINITALNQYGESIWDHGTKGVCP